MNRLKIFGIYRMKIVSTSFLIMLVSLMLIVFIGYSILNKALIGNLYANNQNYLKNRADSIVFLIQNNKDKILNFSSAANSIYYSTEAFLSEYAKQKCIEDITDYYEDLVLPDFEIDEVILLADFGRVSTKKSGTFFYSFEKVKENDAFLHLIEKETAEVLSYDIVQEVGIPKEELDGFIFIGKYIRLGISEAFIILKIDPINEVSAVDRLTLLSEDNKVLWKSLNDISLSESFQNQIARNMGNGEFEFQYDKDFVTIHSVNDQNMYFMSLVNAMSTTMELENIKKKVLMFIGSITILFLLLNLSISKQVVKPLVNLKEDVLRENISRMKNIGNYYAEFPFKWLNHITFRSKFLICFFLLTVLPVIIVMAFIYYNSNLLISRYVVDSAKNNVLLAGGNIDYIIKKAESTAISIALSDEIQTILYYENNYKYNDLKTVVSANILEKAVLKNGIKYINVFTTNGKMVYTIPSVNNSVNTMDLEALDEFITRDNLVKVWTSGRYDYSGALNYPLFMKIKLKVPDSNKYLEDSIVDPALYYQEIGYVEMGLSENYLSSMMESLKNGNSSEAMVIDSKGNIMSHSYKHLLNSKSIHVDTAALSDDRDWQIKTLSNQENFNIYYQLSENLDWFISVSIPNREMFENKDMIIWNYLKLMTIVLFIIAIISVYVSDKMARPLRELEDFMFSVVNGSTSKKPLKKYKENDEVASLVNSFSEMIIRFENMINEIYKSKIKEKELKAEQHQLERRKKEAEIIALQSQINPHFLYNTFSSINFMIMLKKNEAATKMLNCVGVLFRKGVYRGSVLVEAEEELAHVQAYVSIQKMRYEEKLNVIWDIDDNVYRYKLLKFTMQPVVENAIYHGIELKDGIGTVNIKVTLKEDIIEFIIRDDGIGIADDLLNTIQKQLNNVGQGVNIGLKNVNERIKLYFGEQHGISITSRENEGTTVVIIIPAILSD